MSLTDLPQDLDERVQFFNTLSDLMEKHAPEQKAVKLRPYAPWYDSRIQHLSQLQIDFGMGDGVLAWMKSYLEERQQRVQISGASSEKVGLKHGFPQGSCIGPFMFKLYTKVLTEIAHHHGINIHLYTDDTKLYISFRSEDSKRAMEKRVVH